MIKMYKKTLFFSALLIFSIPCFIVCVEPQKKVTDIREQAPETEQTMDSFEYATETQDPVNIPEQTSESANGYFNLTDDQDEQESTLGLPVIKEIVVQGNKYVATEAILHYIPYKVDELFNRSKSGDLIRNLYFELKRFSNITVKIKNNGDGSIVLYVIVEEKPVLKEVILEGNKAISEKDIRKKVTLDMPAIQEGELAIIAQKIKKLYLDQGFCQTEVAYSLVLDDAGKATAYISITENLKSLIKEIRFTGNDHVSSKILRNVLLTKEDWVLSFLDKSGTFHPERLQADKYMIEQYYQNSGFLLAKVTDIEKDIDAASQSMILTFNIEEGPLYTIEKIEAVGNELVSQEQLLAAIPLKPGTIYSRKNITDSIKILEFVWGNYGYIFSHIEPAIDVDDEKKTVSVNFISELGNKVTLNKINIKGNEKTRDKVIRRRIALEEGGFINNRIMELSKNSVESLGYFDPREGVNWKINRLSEDTADLDLILKETRTGNALLQMGFGGSGMDMRSPNSGFSVKAGYSDRNLFGRGINVSFDASWARSEQNLIFHVGQPWLFDRPISGTFDLYHRRPTYDMLRHINPNTVSEKLTGVAAGTGIIVQTRNTFFNNTQIRVNFGVDRFAYERKAVAVGLGEEKNSQYQSILDKEFLPGKMVWLAAFLEQDMRNHPIHTSRGHRLALTSKLAIPSFGDHIGFYKMTAEASWFTPLIGEQDLVLRLRSFFGFVAPLNNNTVPYGELFHVGGASNVRGFLFGQIGPKFEGDSIGGKKAFFVNAELLFPITADLNMKGAFFYDGGASFDNPYANSANVASISGNHFNYRHSVGFGVRLLNPMPIKIDWGFKIDPRTFESTHEVHFGMTYDW